MSSGRLVCAADVGWLAEGGNIAEIDERAALVARAGSNLLASAATARCAAVTYRLFDGRPAVGRPPKSFQHSMDAALEGESGAQSAGAATREKLLFVPRVLPLSPATAAQFAQAVRLTGHYVGGRACRGEARPDEYGVLNDLSRWALLRRSVGEALEDGGCASLGGAATGPRHRLCVFSPFPGRAVSLQSFTCAGNSTGGDAVAPAQAQLDAQLRAVLQGAPLAGAWLWVDTSAVASAGAWSPDPALLRAVAATGGLVVPACELVAPLPAWPAPPRPSALRGAEAGSVSLRLAPSAEAPAPSAAFCCPAHARKRFGGEGALHCLGTAPVAAAARQAGSSAGSSAAWWPCWALDAAGERLLLALWRTGRCALFMQAGSGEALMLTAAGPRTARGRLIDAGAARTLCAAPTGSLCPASAPAEAGAPPSPSSSGEEGAWPLLPLLPFPGVDPSSAGALEALWATADALLPLPPAPAEASSEQPPAAAPCDWSSHSARASAALSPRMRATLLALARVAGVAGSDAAVAERDGPDEDRGLGVHLVPPSDDGKDPASAWREADEAALCADVERLASTGLPLVPGVDASLWDSDGSADSDSEGDPGPEGAAPAPGATGRALLADLIRRRDALDSQAGVPPETVAEGERTSPPPPTGSGAADAHTAPALSASQQAEAGEERTTSPTPASSGGAATATATASVATATASVPLPSDDDLRRALLRAYAAVLAGRRSHPVDLLQSSLPHLARHGAPPDPAPAASEADEEEEGEEGGEGVEGLLPLCAPPSVTRAPPCEGADREVHVRREACRVLTMEVSALLAKWEEGPSSAIMSASAPAGPALATRGRSSGPQLVRASSAVSLASAMALGSEAASVEEAYPCSAARDPGRGKAREMVMQVLLRLEARALPGRGGRVRDRLPKATRRALDVLLTPLTMALDEERKGGFADFMHRVVAARYGAVLPKVVGGLLEQYELGSPPPPPSAEACSGGADGRAAPSAKEAVAAPEAARERREAAAAVGPQRSGQRASLRGPGLVAPTRATGATGSGAGGAGGAGDSGAGAGRGALPHASLQGTHSGAGARATAARGHTARGPESREVVLSQDGARVRVPPSMVEERSGSLGARRRLQLPSRFKAESATLRVRAPALCRGAPLAVTLTTPPIPLCPVCRPC